MEIENKEVTAVSVDETIKKLHASGVRFVLSYDSEMKKVNVNTYDNPLEQNRKIDILRKVTDALGMRARKAEKVKCGDGGFFWRAEESGVRVDSPMGYCKIVGYEKRVVPGEPERYTPPKPDTVIEVPVYECVDE